MDQLHSSKLAGNIAIVGNGHIDPSLYDQINAASHVIRFNNPSPLVLSESAKTDALVLSNSSKQTRALLASPSYMHGRAFSKAATIILPYHPSIIAKYMPKPNPLSYLRGARADYTRLCIQACLDTGKHYEILPSEIYFEVCDALGICKKKMHQYFPSSGIMIIHTLLNQLGSTAHVDIYGFGFTGWKRHNWESERSYVSKILSGSQLTAWS